MTNSAPNDRPVLHRGADAEVVADALAVHLAEAPTDVFGQLLVTCEGPGDQRWLAHRLTRRLGIAAGIAMPSSRSWLDSVAARSLGIDPETDPWRAHRLVWEVLHQLGRDDLWRGSALEATGANGGSLWLARHITTIMLGYARRDPALLARWSQGDDSGVPTELTWQPRLWRCLLSAPATAPVPDPVARLAPAQEVLRSGGHVPDLPAEVHLWAPDVLGAGHVELLVALAERGGVHIWLPGRVEATDHPLVMALDRETASTVASLEDAGASTVHLVASATSRDTLLDRLRTDLSAGTPSAAQPLGPQDTSITLHSCHGPERQAEVLRDVLCGLLEDDPTLEPRDVLVAVADPLMFPVLEAAFAQVDLPGTPGHPARTLPVRFADPELRDHNLLVSCLVDALRLGRGRAGVTELVSFLSTAPVARRFGLDEDGLRRAHEMVSAAGVRWGMNAAHRGRFGLESVAANTWLTGLNRMLVGIAMSEDGSHAVRSALPLDDVGSSDIEVVGAVAELMVRLIRLARDTGSDHTPHQWVRICREAVEALMTPSAEDAWQLDHAWQVLADIAEAAPVDAPPLPLDDLLDLLDDAVRGRSPRSAFRSGAVTVCTLWPARHVPHRVVCIVGLDDGILPRPERVDGDDLLDLHPTPESLGPRHRDRQVFLDLVRSARQHLVLAWTGADPRSGEHRPPAVVVAALLDTLDAMVELPEGRSAGRVLLTRHPLQPYAPETFGDPSAAPYRAGARSGFDPAAAAAAATLLRTTPGSQAAGTRGALASRLEVPAWQWEGDVAPLADVLDVLTHPARAFLRRRAGFTRWSEDEDPGDAIPIELDALQAWKVGDRVLDAALRGDSLDDALRAEHLRGALPPGAAGVAVLERVRTEADRILHDSSPLRTEAPLTRHVRVPLPGAGLVLSADITLRGRAVVDVGYSKVSPRQRLTSWFALLALVAAGEVDSPRAHLFGRRSQLSLAPPDRDTALFLLNRWVGIATSGLTTPLPLPLKTGAMIAASIRPGTGPADLGAHRDLRQCWERECDGNWNLLWGGDLTDLVGARRPDEMAAIGAETTWIADLARGLWSPIDLAEESR